MGKGQKEFSPSTPARWRLAAWAPLVARGPWRGGSRGSVRPQSPACNCRAMISRWKPWFCTPRHRAAASPKPWTRIKPQPWPWASQRLLNPGLASTRPQRGMSSWGCQGRNDWMAAHLGRLSPKSSTVHWPERTWAPGWPPGHRPAQPAKTTERVVLPRGAQTQGTPLPGQHGSGRRWRQHQPHGHAQYALGTAVDGPIHLCPLCKPAAPGAVDIIPAKIAPQPDGA